MPDIVVPSLRLTKVDVLQKRELDVVVLRQNGSESLLNQIQVPLRPGISQLQIERIQL